jgi:deoxyribose-phosphate aldolase
MTPLQPTRSQVAAIIDHTLLTPSATAADVERLVEEAVELGVLSVCISPNQLPIDAPEDLVIATVVGFPSGAHLSEVKAIEAAFAAANGADEVDMVINLGAAKAGDWDAVLLDIASVRLAAPGVLLKVIIESAALTDDEIVRACEVAEEAGADFVKTSTGFHRAGEATVEAVRLMRATVGDRLGVKASGGIRTTEQSLAMIDAGATRLGMSGTRAVLAGLAE